MSARTTRLIASAERMITKFGRVADVVFSRAVDSSYSTSTATFSTVGTPTTFSLKAAPIDFSLYEINNTTQLEGTKKLYIAGGQGYTPQVSDTVALGSFSYRVLKVVSYETESVDVAYELHIGI